MGHSFSRVTFATLVLSLAFSVSARAESTLLTFDDFADFDIGTFDATRTSQHGLVVNNGVTNSTPNNPFTGLGLQIDVLNVTGSPDQDLGILFDSTLSGTRDPDLEGPPWSGGNLDTNTPFGNMLIIAEHAGAVPDPDGGVYVPTPDDEGQRPAGFILLSFEFALDAFGFDLIDIEVDEASDGYVASVFSGGIGGTPVGEINFVDFISRDNAGFGNHSVNTIAPLTASELGVQSFDTILFKFGGSGAIDNLFWNTTSLDNNPAVPEPTSMALFAIGAACLAGRYRRRQPVLPDDSRLSPDVL